MLPALVSNHQISGGGEIQQFRKGGKPAIMKRRWGERGIYQVTLYMCSIRDGPVDLVGGGGVEEFVRAQKGHKKKLHTQHCKKKFAKQNIKRCDRTIYTV